MNGIFSKPARLLLVMFLLAISLAIPPYTASAFTGATLTVNSNSDADNGSDGVCTIREAMIAALNDANYHECTFAGTYGIDTIVFSVSGSSTITLTSNLPAVSSGALTIDGSNAGSPIVIDGANTYQPFVVGASASLTLKNSTVQHGSASSGGGVYNNGGTLNVIQSTLLNNTAVNDGGAIVNWSGTATIVNSTFSGNSASYGGGMAEDGGTVTIINSTFSGNTAAHNGGAFSSWNTPVTSIYNTIMTNSLTAPEDCWLGLGSTTLSGDHNIIRTTGGGIASCSSITASTSDPALGSLTGSPVYFPLRASSPAIDAANDTMCATAPVNNASQNGATRPQGAHCDIGSFEFAPTFADVPMNYWAWQSIERLYSAGITGGCGASPLTYCPDNNVTRDQMAVFLERGMHTSSFSPPIVPLTFSDTSGNFAQYWIEALKSDGITSGCGTNLYCPTSATTRAQMAIFLLKSEHGTGFSPPPATGTKFGDVPSLYWDAAWIEQLANEGVTSGCGGGNYCPDSPVTRAQMAVFLVKIFSLP